MELSGKIEAIARAGEARWAFDHYRDTVLDLARILNARSLLEVGGGRSPLLTERELARHDIRYTANDISERELERAPNWVGKACFDIQTPDHAQIEQYAGQFDLIFSRMVMEHVPSYQRAYRNIFTLLQPGGVAIAFHPVLFAFPFVINKLMPETASRRLLSAFFPNRNDDQLPKFPAFYSGCRIASDVQRRLRETGFRDVWQVPFYGHGYYKRIPVLRDLAGSFSAFARRHNLKGVATYAYTIVRR